MDYRSLKLLSDIQKYVEIIARLTNAEHWTFEAADDVERLAIERGFEVIGVALTRLERHDPKIVASISQFRTIVAFRNRIAHGYDDDLNARIFDEVVHEQLPVFRREVVALLADMA